jgi:hypothetical protein
MGGFGFRLEYAARWQTAQSMLGTTRSAQWIRRTTTSQGGRGPTDLL